MNFLVLCGFECSGNVLYQMQNIMNLGMSLFLAIFFSIILVKKLVSKEKRKNIRISIGIYLFFFFVCWLVIILGMEVINYLFISIYSLLPLKWAPENYNLCLYDYNRYLREFGGTYIATSVYLVLLMIYGYWCRGYKKVKNKKKFLIIFIILLVIIVIFLVVIHLLILNSLPGYDSFYWCENACYC